MTAIQTRARVARDGTVTVPVGVENAGATVDVTVTPVAGTDTELINGLPRDEWYTIFARTEGSIDDENFTRPTQTVYEHRLPFEDPDVK